MSQTRTGKGKFVPVHN